MAKTKTHGTDVASDLRTQSIGVRLAHRKMGTQRTLERRHRDTAAAALHADGDRLKAAKQLIDTKHPAYRDCVTVRNAATAYWEAMTLPYPMRGVRLMRRDDVAAFETRMSEYEQQLQDAVAALDAVWDELRSDAQKRLGDLYCASDYPTSVAGEFGLRWTFPSLAPPDYLQELAPDLYQRECERVRARFETSVEMAEQAFTDELAKLVSGLCERMSGTDDGKPKVFRDTTVTNLHDFFDRFRHISVRSSGELDKVVDQAQKVVATVDAAALRKDGALRTKVQKGLGKVSKALDAMLVDRPKRRITFDE
jgi:hypothetical protein